MSDGLWWRKMPRNVIRDDRCEMAAYSLEKELRPLVPAFYMAAYMMADDDGTFDWEDGRIFALRTFSDVESADKVRRALESAGVIIPVIEKSTVYIIYNWIDVADGSQYNARPAQSMEQRRASVAKRIVDRNSQKVYARNVADEARRKITDMNRRSAQASHAAPSAQRLPAVDLDSLRQPDPPEPSEKDASVPPGRGDFFCPAPDEKCSDSATISVETSLHSTGQDTTAQDNTEQERTVQNTTPRSAAVAAEEPCATAPGESSAVADEEIKEKQITERAHGFVHDTKKLAAVEVLKANFEQKMQKICGNDAKNAEKDALYALAERFTALSETKNSAGVVASVFCSAFVQWLGKSHPGVVPMPSVLLRSEFFVPVAVKARQVLSPESSAAAWDAMIYSLAPSADAPAYNAAGRKPVESKHSAGAESLAEQALADADNEHDEENSS